MDHSSPPPAPRLCHIIKWDTFDGYGFNIHAEKTRPGQYIGKIDLGSPAEIAGLKEDDRIVEVNGVNVNQENHKQVVERIKSVEHETRLLVVDMECDQYYKEQGIIVSSSFPYVISLSSETTEVVDGETNFTQLEQLKIQENVLDEIPLSDPQYLDEEVLHSEEIEVQSSLNTEYNLQIENLVEKTDYTMETHHDDIAKNCISENRAEIVNLDDIKQINTEKICNLENADDSHNLEDNSDHLGNYDLCKERENILPEKITCLNIHLKNEEGPNTNENKNHDEEDTNNSIKTKESSDIKESVNLIVQEVQPDVDVDTNTEDKSKDTTIEHSSLGELETLNNSSNAVNDHLLLSATKLLEDQSIKDIESSLLISVNKSNLDLGLPDLNLSVKEMRERMGSRKKKDPRKDNRMDFRTKHEIVQTL